MSSSPNMPQANPRILEYRNGMYQGYTKNNKRNGQGILITDENTIIISQWKNDQMTGKGIIILSPEHYGFGDFNRGQIEGGFIWRQRGRMLYGEFNMSRPVNKMVYIEHESGKVQVIVHKTPIFEVIAEKRVQQPIQAQQIFQATNVQVQCPTLIQFLQSLTKPPIFPFSFSDPNNNNINICFKLKSLNNGNLLFYFDDETSPLSLGFCLNKNQQIVSCGMYVGDKLHGLGCKYENAVRYEGMFEAGFVSGVGLKHAQGKYTFGHYQNGNLVEAIYIDDRSTASQQKLLQFKKLSHVRSLWFENSYIKHNLVKFKGLHQLVFEIDSQQQFMYPQTTPLFTSQKKQSQPPSNMNIMTSNQSPQVNRTFSRNLNSSAVNPITNNNLGLQLNNSSPNKNLLASNSKNLALGMLLKQRQGEGDKLQTKSSKEYIGRGPILADQLGNSEVRFNGESPNLNRNNGVFNAKTTVDRGYGERDKRGQEAQFKNPEDSYEFGQETPMRNSGLKNLRKFKY